MLGYLILLFCAVPFIELYLLFTVAGHIGAGTTLLIVIATGIVGATLARMQGFQVLGNIQRDLASQRMPTTALVDGAMILFAAALLLTPGILTDLFGFSLLMPPIRAVYRRVLMRHFKNRVQVHVSGMATGAADAESAHRQTEIIEAHVTSTNTSTQEKR